MAKINFGAVASVGVVPKVTNLLVELQVTKVTVGESKTSGNRMATLELEIVGGDTELLDANGQQLSVLGLKPSMFVILEEEDPRAMSNLKELLTVMELPLELDPADDAEVMQTFGKLRFGAYISSKQTKATAWDTAAGKEVPAKDADGRQLLGPCQWDPVNVNKVTGPVAAPTN